MWFPTLFLELAQKDTCYICHTRKRFFHIEYIRFSNIITFIQKLAWKYYVPWKGEDLEILIGIFGGLNILTEYISRPLSVIYRYYCLAKRCMAIFAFGPSPASRILNNLSIVPPKRRNYFGLHYQKVCPNIPNLFFHIGHSRSELWIRPFLEYDVKSDGIYDIKIVLMILFMVCISIFQGAKRWDILELYKLIWCWKFFTQNLGFLTDKMLSNITFVFHWQLSQWDA